MKNKKTFYITTPIYYPSGNLHIGHLYSTTIAWVLRNYKRKMNYDTKFLTGSDEHGQKIEKKANEFNMSFQDYVDMQTSKFIKLWELYGIDYDFFSRTTSKKHVQCIETIFNNMLKKGVIYKGIYKGLYSIEDEEFITESQAIKKENIFFHPISNHQLQIIEEESYFFKMSKFSNWLIEYVENHKDFIIPHKIWGELKSNFLDKNLEDLSITRISFEWGIKINSDSKHVVYVWLDALFNYISALGYENSENDNYLKYWENGNEIVHIVGKEIIRFHCIYWPIFLKSLDIKLPTKIVAHGWIVTPEGKMSKSKGNVIDPIELLNEFDKEVIKYYFVSKLNINNDGIFSKDLLLSTYNSDLVNTIGNLVSRTLAMINKNFSRPICFTETQNEHDVFILKNISDKFKNYQHYFDNYEINKAFDAMVDLAKDLNKYIDLTMPWTLKDDLIRLEQVLNILLNGIYSILAMLEIVMPEHSNKFREMLNIDSLDFSKICDYYKFDNIKVQKNQIIFPRK